MQSSSTTGAGHTFCGRSGRSIQSAVAKWVCDTLCVPVGRVLRPLLLLPRRFIIEYGVFLGGKTYQDSFLTVSSNAGKAERLVDSRHSVSGDSSKVVAIS